MSPAKRYIVAPQGGGPPLLITSNSPLVSGEVGLAYSQTLQGTGGAPPYFWSLISGFFPTGLSLSVGGVVSGTPTATGSSTVVLQIMDSRGARSPVKSFGITIVAAVSITTSTPLPPASQGIVYNQAIAATGGVTPYTWSIASQTGTNTWSIGSSSGILTGTPANAETDSITVEVMDALGGISTKVFSLTVQATAATPTFSPPAGTYVGTQTVTISCATPSSSIFYTTNGTAPTTGSTPYTVPISVSVSQTVKAIATATGFAQSAVGSATYTINSGSSLAISTASLGTPTVGGSFFQQINATGGVQPYFYGIQGPDFGGFNYSVIAPVTTVTQTTNAVFTLSSTASTHPLAGQTQCMVYPVSGSWKPNFYQSGAITALSSSQPWTVTTNMNFSNSSYGLNNGVPQIYPCALAAGPTGVNPYQMTRSGSVQVVPTTAETATLPILVRDSTGAIATASLPITVGTALQILGVSHENAIQPLPTAMQYNAYRHTFTCAGGTGTGQVWTISGLPSGITASGPTISGIPTGTDSTDELSVTVTDSAGPPVTAFFNLVVLSNANVARPSYNTGISWFIANGKLYDPNGAPFTIWGMNQAHYDSSSTSALASIGCNAVRIFSYLVNSQGGYPASAYTPVVSATAAADMMPIFSFNHVPGAGIANATITGTAGQFSCAATSLPILVGMTIIISGTITGTGSITGYNPSGNNTYLVGATNGSTTFTLTTTSGGAIATVAGTGTGIQWQGGGASGNTNVVDVQATANWIAQNWTAFDPNTVWNILNEWSGTNANWLTAYESAVSTIRAAGCKQLLMIDANGSGQNWAVLVANAAAVQSADPQQNIIFSFHAYGATHDYQAPITSIVSSGSQTIIGINFTGAYNPFNNYSLGDNANGGPSSVWIQGVSGMTQINGLNPAIASLTPNGGGPYFITVTLNSSGFSTYTGGGTVYPAAIGPVIAPALAALASSNVCCVIGEAGPGKWIGTNSASPTSATNGEVAAAAIANGLGMMYWAIDDNNLASNSTSQNWFGSLLVNASYSSAASLTYVGLDAAFNPNTGVNGIATPASYYVGGSDLPSVTFDHYVSPTGSDTNAGTLAAPWAITSLSVVYGNGGTTTPYTSAGKANCIASAGKKIGFLPGTYDVSALMGSAEVTSGPPVGALQIIGGTSATATTYWASCNASGQYSPRTATLDAKGASGIFGGAHSTGVGIAAGPIIAHTGKYPQSYATGWATIDGLRFTGFSYKAIMIGDGSYEGGNLDTITNPVTIQNCEFTGGGYNSGDNVDNQTSIWTDHNVNAITVNNNWIHDNTGHTANSGDHLNAIIVWGFGQTSPGPCTGTVVTNNTCVNSGNIYGKEGQIQGTIVRNNYVDCSMYTAANSIGIQDFTGWNVGGLTLPTYIQNNVVILSSGTTASFEALGGISTKSLSAGAWTTGFVISNNTVINVATAASGTPVAFMDVQTGSAGVGAGQFYNNIYANLSGKSGTGSIGNYGNYAMNPQALALMDYNLNPATNVGWNVTSNSSLGSIIASYTSYSAFAAGLAANGGISNAEAHSVTGSPTFTNTGTYAALYQLASGSVGKNAGSTTGTTSGTATDMGAWGNGASQVGCNFAT